MIDYKIIICNFVMVKWGACAVKNWKRKIGEFSPFFPAMIIILFPYM